MRLNVLCASAAMLVFAVAVPTIPPFVVDAAQSAPAPAQPAAAEPQATEFQKLKLENLQLKFGALQQQQIQVQQEYTALIHQIEQEHPGYIWSLAEGRLRPVAPLQTKPAIEPAKKETK